MKNFQNTILICCLFFTACSGEPIDLTAEVVNSSTLNSVTADKLILNASIVQYNDRENADIEVVALDATSHNQIRFDQGETLEAGAGIFSENDEDIDYAILDEEYEFYDPIFSIFYEANVGGKIAKTNEADDSEVYFIGYTDKNGNHTFTTMFGGAVSDILTPAANAELDGNIVEITWNPEETFDFETLYLYVKWQDEDGDRSQLLELNNTGSYELDISEMDGSGSIQLRTLIATNSTHGDFDETDIRLTNIAEVEIADFRAD